MKTTKVSPKKSLMKQNGESYTPPEKLSKAGIWRMNHPGGIVIINDYRAVCK